MFNCVTPMEIRDLLIAKWAAYRPKDIEFCSAAIRLGLAQKETLLGRLQQTSLTAEQSRVIEQTIQRLFGQRQTRADLRSLPARLQ